MTFMQLTVVIINKITFTYK